MIRGSQGDLYVDDGGSGDLAVFFVHSAAGNAAQWAAQLAHLRKTRRAVALDLRGHGKSALPADGDFTIAGMSKDIGAVADALKIERFVLVGHSMGGFVSIAYARAHPDRVAGLFLLDPASDGRSMPKEQADGLMAALRSDAYQQTIDGYWQSIIGAVPAVCDQLMKDLHGTPRQTVINSLESLLSFDPVTPIRAYPGPKRTLITSFNETPASLQNLIPDLPSEKIDGTGHWLQIEKPAAVNARLDAFLAAVN